jgi:hypothetical protein
MGKKTGKKGPDPIEIPKEQALQLAEAGWSNEGIASFFKCSVDTLTRRIPAEELRAAYEGGNCKLMQALFTRAMGGRMEKRLPDGSIQVFYLQSSDRLLQHALDRRCGKVKQEVEINPNPDRPANVNGTVSFDLVKKAVQKLEEEY